VDHEVQRLQLDFDLGVMELSPDGQRIEHTVPLRAFLDDGMCMAPFELPAPCNEAACHVWMAVRSTRRSDASWKANPIDSWDSGV